MEYNDENIKDENIEMPGVFVTVCSKTICISLDDGTNSNYYDLAQIEEFQGRLAIAAAKLRGKLAKEATSQ